MLRLVYCASMLSHMPIKLYFRKLVAVSLHLNKGVISKTNVKVGFNWFCIIIRIPFTHFSSMPGADIHYKIKPNFAHQFYHLSRKLELKIEKSEPLQTRHISKCLIFNPLQHIFSEHPIILAFRYHD